MMRFDSLNVLSRAYATLLFVEHPWAGLLVIAATLWYPNIGLAGLLGASVGLLTARLFRFPEAGASLQIYNSLLVGLSLGAFYRLDPYLAGLIVLGAVLAVLLTVAIAEGLWRLDRLPALSIPFLVVALFTAPVAQRHASLADYLALATPEHALFFPWLDGFFSSLGSALFTPHPLAGVLLFAAIAWRSRYLALLAFIGYAFGWLVFHLLTDAPHPALVVWTGFNFMLVTMAVGGFYTIPGLAGVLTALLAVALTALLVVATQDLLLVEGLPVMAIPFVLVTLTVLAVLGRRTGLSRPWRAPQPGLPEVNYERARLAQVRNGEFDSVPLLPPFFGEWEVYQGFDGEHTHRGQWRHALDFFRVENGRSFRREGKALEDYLCFGLPVLSPAHGIVVRARDALADNPPGEVDVRHNWGNFVLIRMDNGLHVLLGHLRQGSLKVAEGDRVEPGMPLAACGNSGRSPQPHLHLQVQRRAELGSPTHPFHLSSVLLRSPGQPLEYRLVAHPVVGEGVQATAQDEQLSAWLHLPVGRELRYRYVLAGEDQRQVAREAVLRVELTLLGQFRLVSDSGASAAFEEVNGVLAFYDRQGPKDVLLDAWLLANGLTPLSARACRWEDAPSATLLPMSPGLRLLRWFAQPLGGGLDSHYDRRWEPERGRWVQLGRHRLKLPLVEREAQTESVLEPVRGCTRFMLRDGGWRCEARLLDTGLAEDRGIPGWRVAVGRGTIDNPGNDPRSEETAHENERDM